jgi:hypothetical protein
MTMHDEAVHLSLTFWLSSGLKLFFFLLGSEVRADVTVTAYLGRSIYQKATWATLLAEPM